MDLSAYFFVVCSKPRENFIDGNRKSAVLEPNAMRAKNHLFFFTRPYDDNQSYDSMLFMVSTQAARFSFIMSIHLQECRV